MNYYALVSDYYDKGYYTTDQVKVFCDRQKITPEQYAEITGEPYTA
ncbi:XkdX family protein [Acinetobacter baumannii]